jgi:hypothetical protein
MAIDRKYGTVTLERGTIADDEPVVVFRAQDKLLPSVLRTYRMFCMNSGSPERHLDAIDGALAAVEAWQEDHFTKVPTSDPMDA